jgi:hypothetical protein
MESRDEHTPEPRRVNRRDEYRPDSEDENVIFRVTIYIMFLWHLWFGRLRSFDGGCSWFSYRSAVVI